MPSLISWISSFASRVRSSLFPRRITQEFEEELQNHLDSLTQENLRRGMAPAEAHRAAHVRLGGITQLKETNRQLRGLTLVETVWQDSRYALRMLRQNPGFTAVAVLTLALGIGANTAIFSVVYAVLMKPLPYAGSALIHNVSQQLPPSPVGGGWSYPNFAALRDQNHVFSAVAGATRHQLTLTGRGEPVEVNTAVVTEGFFSLFDAQPLAGRVFYPQDAKPGAPPAVVIGENLWRGLLGANPAIIGSAISLDKRLFTVIGVLPAAFCFPLFPAVTEAPQVWIPLPQDPLFGPWMERRSGHWLQVTGRVKPGTSIAQVQAEMDAFGERIAKDFPAENAGWVIRIGPLQDMIVENVRSALFVLLAAVGLVLLIACANIANLLLTRATSRTREIAVRATLGAGRARIVRQLLSETAVLGLLGGAAGIALAYAGVRVLVTLIPSDVPIVNAIRVDYFVLAFALVLSLLASIGFGLAPAFLAANSNLQLTLREGGARSGESSGGRRARNVLAAGEIALAMMLLVAAGLLLRSFAKLTSVNPGFEVQHLVTAEVSLPRFQYSTPQQWVAFSDELLRQLHSEPGLKDCALSVPAPIAWGRINLGFDIVGRPPSSASTSRSADYVSVSTDYFRTMRVSLLAGRAFNERDTMSAPRVALISQALARTYFPDEEPIGKQIVFGFPPDPGVPRQIVGIVGDVRDVSLGDDPKPMMYVPFAQAPFWGAVAIVRSPLGVSSVAATLRHDVAKIDKDLPVTKIAAMPDVLNTSVAQPRFRTFLLGLFAAMALVLAATGIFGVISYSVSRRTHEIGMRMALGASRRTILGLISRETLTLISVGLILGAGSALAASRLLGHLLFGVSASDPLTLVAVATVLAAVAAVAAYVPARRAMSIDPMEALRHE
jgi:putative ABC transport system permease protein